MSWNDGHEKRKALSDHLDKLEALMGDEEVETLGDNGPLYSDCERIHTLLDDVCDAAFGDDMRAEVHGYDGVLERVRELFALAEPSRQEAIELRMKQARDERKRAQEERARVFCAEDGHNWYGEHRTGSDECMRCGALEDEEFVHRPLGLCEGLDGSLAGLLRVGSPVRVFGPEAGGWNYPSNVVEIIGNDRVRLKSNLHGWASGVFKLEYVLLDVSSPVGRRHAREWLDRLGE